MRTFLPIPMTGSLKLSGGVLLLANLIPLVGVMVWGWTVFEVVFLYWLENLVVGFFNLLKILTFFPKEKSGGAVFEKTFCVPFFTVHYGGFCAVHGIFVCELLGDGKGIIESMSIVSNGPLTLAVGSLFISHGFSFFVNYLGGGEFRKGEMGMRMFAPYGRIVVLHLVVLIGAFLIDIFGSPIVLLVLLVIGKIILDLALHIRSHNKAMKEDENVQLSTSNFQR